MQMVSWILKDLEIHCYKEALKIHLVQTTLFPFRIPLPSGVYKHHIYLYTVRYRSLLHIVSSCCQGNGSKSSLIC